MHVLSIKYDFLSLKKLLIMATALCRCSNLIGDAGLLVSPPGRSDAAVEKAQCTILPCRLIEIWCAGSCDASYLLRLPAEHGLHGKMIAGPSKPVLG